MSIHVASFLSGEQWKNFRVDASSSNHCSDPFNGRYNDVFKPAILTAKLEPYRVDEDLGVKMPIESIQQEIRDSVICLVDITRDNPNVWYELGYARALNKDVVMLCGPEREGNKFPFDVQHLTINRYTLDSEPSYGKLRKLISERLQALIKKQDGVKNIVQSPLQPVEGLDPFETTALALIMENSMTTVEGADFDDISRAMGYAGFNTLAAGLSVESLVEMGFVEPQKYSDGNGREYKTYRPTAQGRKWLLNNRSKLQLKFPAPALRPAPFRKPKAEVPYPSDDDFDDSDPFADE